MMPLLKSNTTTWPPTGVAKEDAPRSVASWPLCSGGVVCLAVMSSTDLVRIFSLVYKTVKLIVGNTLH